MSTGVSMTKEAIARVAENFRIYGTLLESQPHGSGHINDTFVTTYSQAGTRVRYIIQRINTQIFKEPEAVMENILRVTDEGYRRLVEADVADPSRCVLTVIPTKEGRSHVRDEQGGIWRCYPFIEGARTYDIIRNARQATEVAKAFGEFQRLVAGMKGARLHETIPDFHNTRSRFAKLQAMVEADPKGRLASVQSEWEFLREREALVDVLLDLQAKGEIPERLPGDGGRLPQRRGKGPPCLLR